MSAPATTITLNPAAPCAGDLSTPDVQRLFRALADELALRRPEGALFSALRACQPRTRDALHLESREAAR